MTMRLRLDKAGNLTLRMGAADMMVDTSEAAANAMLDAAGGMLNNGVIEILDPTGNFLTSLALSSPATSSAVDGVLTFNAIGEGKARTQGTAAIARILGPAPARNEIFMCDVGLPSSDAVVKLSRTQLLTGDSVRLDSFRLEMP